MAEPSLISGYLAELVRAAARAGRRGTGRRARPDPPHYLDQGLDPDAAAEAALAEFGQPHVILAAFTRVSPARRTARRLLATGPIVGACWAAALITSRAWTWPVPVAARVLFGLVLITVIGLLAVAAFGGKYRSVGRAAPQDASASLCSMPPCSSPSCSLFRP